MNNAKHETLYQLPKYSALPAFTTLIRPATIKDSSYPVPIFSINYNKKQLNFDPIASRVKEKDDFDIRKGIVTRCVKSQIPKFPENAVSSDFMKYVAMKLTDPDPTSKRAGYMFDWRHHGGNLSHQKLQKDFYLVQSSFSDSDEIPLRLVKIDGFNSVISTWNEDYLRHNYVYEIHKHHSTYALRKRSSVQIATLTELNAPIEYKSRHEIAACLLTSDDLYSINVTGQLIRRNIVSEMTLPLEKLDLSGYPIIMKQHKTDDTFTINDDARMFMFDVRAGEESQELFDKSHFAFKCEEIFSHETSLGNDNLIFIASSHLLYVCDVRKPGQAAIVQVNHQLIRPPMMMKLALVDDNVEIVCVASNHPNDIKIFSFSHNDGTFDLLPLSPKSLERALHEIQTKGKMLLADYLRERIRMSISGIDMIVNRRKGKLTLFVQTSVGDIFKTEIYTKANTEQNSCNYGNEFKLWDDSVRLNEPVAEDLQFTQVGNLKGLRRVFLHLKPCQKEKDIFNHAKDESNFLQMHVKKAPEWKVSMKKAKNYHDVLAPHILAPWEVEDEDDENDVFVVNESGQKVMKPNEKVFTWLTSHHEETTVKEEDLSGEFMLEKEQNSQLDFSFGDAAECNNANATLNLSLNTVQRANTTATKKKRIKGF